MIIKKLLSIALLSCFLSNSVVALQNRELPYAKDPFFEKNAEQKTKNKFFIAMGGVIALSIGVPLIFILSRKTTMGKNLRKIISGEDKECNAEIEKDNTKKKFKETIQKSSQQIKDAQAELEKSQKKWQETVEKADNDSLQRKKEEEQWALKKKRIRGYEQKLDDIRITNKEEHDKGQITNGEFIKRETARMKDFKEFNAMNIDQKLAYINANVITES